MRRLRLGAGRDDRGVAAAYAVGLVAVLVLVSMLLTAAASVFVQRREAEKAADLAALAGAQAHQGGGDGCAAARLRAEQNGAELTSCAVEGLDVLVAVVVGGHGLLADLTVPGRARAGPMR